MKPIHTLNPTRTDAACQDASATSAPRHHHRCTHLHPVDARRAGVLPQQQRWLDLPDLEQRHHREQERYEHADADALKRLRTTTGRR